MTSARRPEAPAGRQAPTGITIVSSQFRSINLERDVQAAHLGPVAIGVRAQDMLDRIAAAMADSSRTRAWSITGPYGSGKSTLALAATALLGRETTWRAEADELIAGANPALARHLADARDHAAPDGMITCVATARREPLADTMTRAIQDGIARGFAPGRPPKALRDEARLMKHASGGEITGLVRRLCESGPVLLVIDEFGKSLEHLASRGEFADAASDLYLLQELAELGAGSRGLPLYLLTLQHLAFADYASRTTALQSREWAKIQGRFEDVMMTPHLGDAVELIRSALDHRDVPPEDRKLITAHADAAAEAWIARGLESILPADRELFADVYPLHPLTTVTAPLLAAQIGQHERSITGFIGGDEPHTVRRFLAAHATANPAVASTIRLADAYDFFFTAGRTTVLASANAGRWMEIDSRISEAGGLPDEDQAILKTVGLLNLVDSSGALRASMDTILFALCGPAAIDDIPARQQLANRVHALCSCGFLVYREFSDEFRVWQGSDTDINGHIEALISSTDDHAAVAAATDYLPTAVVAGKHSQRTGMLRYFSTRATDAATGPLAGPTGDDPADGLLIFHFGDEASIPPVRTTRPVIAGVTAESKSVLNAARYLHALHDLRNNLVLDAAASREVAERITQAGAELATRITEAFAPNQLHARWFLLRNDGTTARWAEDDNPKTARSLAALASVACEAVFPQTPHIRNEMLGRHTLTSMGAKARRELMLAMVNAPTQRYLGIQGYGPDRAMYSGVLEYLGLHRPAAALHGHDDALLPFEFCEPGAASTLHPAWTALRELLQAATARPVSLSSASDLLAAPPFGIRPGVIPIIMLTALITGSQEYAVFEDGTYQARLTEALVERLAKNPERFSVKTMGTQTGPRKATVAEIARYLGTQVSPATSPGARNVAPLAVTRDLLDRVRTLTVYARRTQALSDQARAVRTALNSAREPDTLLFSDLPQALGLPPVPVRGKTDTEAVTEYATSLNAALTEIGSLDHRLRDQVINVIADAFRLPADLPALRRQLAVMAAPLAGLNLTDPKLRGLVSLAQDTTLTDTEWIEPLVVRFISHGLSDWRDGDLTALTTEVKAAARAVERLTHLYQPATSPAPTGYTTRVLTLTHADGHEDHTVVHIADAERNRVRQMAARIVEAAHTELGRHGERLLLAVLAETVLAERDTHEDTPSRS